MSAAAVPFEEMTPREIVAELDRYIVGQASAKRAVAVALRNRYRRSRLDDDLREEVIPKNILMIGPTGVGKTEIARRLAKLARAPFLKVEATKFTEVGYVGRDVDSIVRDLMQISIRLVESEMIEAVQERAGEIALDKIVDILHPRKSRVSQTVERVAKSAQEQFSEMQKHIGGMFGFSVLSNAKPTSTDDKSDADDSPEAEEPPVIDPVVAAEEDALDEKIRQKISAQILSGERDDDEIEIDVEESGGARISVLPLMGGPGGPGDGMDLQEMLGDMLPRRRKKRRLPIREARTILTSEAARTLIDSEAVSREAVSRAEESGIIFIDEIDKVAGRGGEGRGPDVSREGVQRDLLPIVEGSTVQTKYGPVRTNHVLFIAAGAFHVAKPSDLIPELQGRLPIRVELTSLGEEDFRRILTEPRAALTRQYQALLAIDGVTVTFTDDAVSEIARLAVEVNTRTENIGARRLSTVMERLLEELSFDAPDTAEKCVVVDGAFVRERLKDVALDDEMSRYIL